MSFFSLYGEASIASKQKVLVYKGPGGCQSCALAASKAVRGSGYEIVYVSPKDISEETLANAAMWIQPAGNAISAANAIGDDKLALIRAFVERGGAYLGFCSGAFLADTTVDDDGKVKGIGLLPFSTADYEVDQDDNVDMVWMKWGSRPRHVFFNGGATFVLPSPLPHGLKVLATYQPDGKPAAIQTKFGRGNVVLTGAHPEAPEKWKSDRKLKDLDGSDLALAQGMAALALGKKLVFETEAE